MEELKKQAVPRALIGGLAGLLVLTPIGAVLNGHLSAVKWVSGDLAQLVGSGALALAIQLVLYFLLGALAGVAALPFADDGKTLALRSLAHFAATAGVYSALFWLCRWTNLFGMDHDLGLWLVELAVLAVLYLLIWLGRWVGWYAEVAAIREKLGLAPGPSLFHWKETLPYLGFAGLFCLAAPVIVWACDDHRIPLLSILYAVVILPLAGFTSGLSLGRRHGFCPLYPVACGAVAGVFVAAAWLCSYSLGGSRILAAAFSALAGNLAGAALLRRKRQKADLCGREGS